MAFRNLFKGVMLASAFLVPTAFAAPTQDVNESISRHHDPSKLIRMAASEMMKRQAEYQQDGQGWATCANGQFISFDGGIAYHYDQSTGNFYVTENGSIVWQTRVNSPCATQCDCLLTFQSDGNLVTYNTNSAGQAYATWDAATQGGNDLIFRNFSPYIVIEYNDGSAIWSSSPFPPTPHNP